MFFFRRSFLSTNALSPPGEQTGNRNIFGAKFEVLNAYHACKKSVSTSNDAMKRFYEKKPHGLEPGSLLYLALSFLFISETV